MSDFKATTCVARRKRALVPNLECCDLEEKISLSALTAPTTIAPVPTQIVVPVGTGHLLYPVQINDPGNYPAGDGHLLPGFELDPGEQPGSDTNETFPWATPYGPQG